MGNPESAAPVLTNVRRHSGIAGQFSVSADVTYPDEPMRPITFVGSVYGGPVLMCSGIGETYVQTFITDPNRFGKFGEDWVRRFFGEDEPEMTCGGAGGHLSGRSNRMKCAVER